MPKGELDFTQTENLERIQRINWQQQDLGLQEIFLEVVWKCQAVLFLHHCNLVEKFEIPLLVGFFLELFPLSSILLEYFSVHYLLSFFTYVQTYSTDSEKTNR